MDSDKNHGYDYLITDSNGTRKVINGVEYPATETDLPKEHKDSGCKECSFVQDKETLLLYVIKREARERATAKPSFVGKFSMTGWVGHCGFYLFRCRECGKVSVDYPHGYTSDGLISGLSYLRCDGCGLKFAQHLKEIYTNEGMETPPGFLGMMFGTIKTMWKMRRTV